MEEEDELVISVVQQTTGWKNKCKAQRPDRACTTPTDIRLEQEKNSPFPLSIGSITTNCLQGLTEPLSFVCHLGANPALYSRKLMHYAFLELEKYDNIEEDAFYDYFNVNPVHILQKSYEQSARDAKKEVCRWRNLWATLH